MIYGDLLMIKKNWQTNPMKITQKRNKKTLNKSFEDFEKQLEELKKEGAALKKPIDIPQDKLEENEIKKEQQNASDELDEKGK